jgi:hypothetical protein
MRRDEEMNAIAGLRPNDRGTGTLRSASPTSSEWK